MRKCWTHNSRADQAVVLAGGGAWPESHRLAWQRTAHRGPPVCRAPEGTEEPDHGARDRQRDPRVTAITTSAKVAHNFPWSLFETARKRCNSNDTNSMFEQAAGELRAKLLNDSGARGRWQGLGDTKSARNFPRSLFETAQIRCNSNDTNSNSEIATGELRAKLLSSRQDGATHNRTSRAAGVEGAGGSGGA